MKYMAEIQNKEDTRYIGVKPILSHSGYAMVQTYNSSPVKKKRQQVKKICPSCESVSRSSSAFLSGIPVL
jgi:hypothetical protein